MTKYYGPYKVVDEIKDDKRNEVLVTLERIGQDGKPYQRRTILSKKTAEDIIVDVEDEKVDEYLSQMDFNRLEDLRLTPVVHDILEILLSYNVKLSEIPSILKRIEANIEESVDTAYTKLFDADIYDRTLSHIDRVLKSDEKTS